MWATFYVDVFPMYIIIIIIIIIIVLTLLLFSFDWVASAGLKYSFDTIILSYIWHVTFIEEKYFVG